MKAYTKTYMKFFGYTIADFMICEIPDCGKRAVDVCHIRAHSLRKDLMNDINNLMGKCREHHSQYGGQPAHYDYLQEIHNKFMEENGKA